MGGPQGRRVTPQRGPKTWLNVVGLSNTSRTPGEVPENVTSPLADTILRTGQPAPFLQTQTKNELNTLMHSCKDRQGKACCNT